MKFEKEKLPLNNNLYNKLNNICNFSNIRLEVLRARNGASVSMPIAWEELDTVTPSGINMKDAIDRLRLKDPWENFFQIKQQLK